MNVPHLASACQILIHTQFVLTALATAAASYAQGRHESELLAERDSQLNIIHHSIPSLIFDGPIQEFENSGTRDNFLFAAMQKKATSLIRSSAAHNQLDTFPGSNSADTDGHGCAFPTLEQHAAIDILRAFDEEKILAWITVIRSIQSGFQHRAGHGAISREQLDALSILRDCHDSDIVAWLQYHRLSGQ